MKTQNLSPEAVDTAAEEVRHLTGLIFQPNRRADFAGALSHAMKRAGERNPEQYLEKVRQDSSLQDDLIAEITVGETYFFRDPSQLRVVRELALDSFPRNRHLRLWSAGCATGEEPYTLAMMVKESGHDNATIVGTDLSRVALARAQKARYTAWSLRGVSEAAIRRFFDVDGKHAQPVNAIRNAVEFHYLNLAEDAYPSLTAGIWHMDVILCRNVLIYLDEETVTRVAARLLESLSPDGWLFLGGADPMLGNLVPCEVITTNSGLAYRKKGTQTAVSVPVAKMPAPLPPLETTYDTPVFELFPPAELTPAAASEGSWVERIRAYANRGEIEAATRLCEQALEQDRESAELFYLQSVLLAEAGHYEAAGQSARRALYIDRDLAVAHIALGNCLARTGDMRGARVALRNAQRLLTAMAPDAIVTASDGEAAGRLAEMARIQLQLTEGAA